MPILQSCASRILLVRGYASTVDIGCMAPELHPRLPARWRFEMREGWRMEIGVPGSKELQSRERVSLLVDAVVVNAVVADAMVVDAMVYVDLGYCDCFH